MACETESEYYKNSRWKTETEKLPDPGVLYQWIYGFMDLWIDDPKIWPNVELLAVLFIRSLLKRV